MRSDIDLLVDSVIREDFKFFDLDPYKSKNNHSEVPQYLLNHQHEYVRTIYDIVKFAERHNVKKVLEIGAFFGVVSICLSKLGFYVCAIDIPEYMSMPEQKERFGRHGIKIAEVRLQDYLLPFQDEYFDAIIMCEVLEHLNFNPLPLIKEINRVGAPDSLYYLSLSNLAFYKNRLKFLFGYSILQPVNNYFKQLDSNELEIVNGHWREYTGAEILELLQRMGYKIDNQYYFSIVDNLKNPTFKNRLTRLVFRFLPSFKENLTTLAIREKRTEHIFRIPSTVHKEIRVL